MAFLYLMFILKFLEKLKFSRNHLLDFQGFIGKLLQNWLQEAFSNAETKNSKPPTAGSTGLRREVELHGGA